MAKFKEGDVVKTIRDTTVMLSGTIGTVIDYLGKDRVSVDFGKDIGVVRMPEEMLDFVSTPTVSLRKFLEELIKKDENPETSPPMVSPVKDAFTDPNVDYEALSEEPVYYEFIDIGKALNKLKKYEHLGCKPSDSEEEELIYIINLRSHKVVTPYLVLKKEYNGRDLIKYTVKSTLGNQLDIRIIDRDIVVFTKLKEALEYLETLNKLDEAEETPF